MGKAYRNASIQHCPYRIHKRRAFALSGKIHKSKRPRCMSAAVLPQSKHLKVDYDVFGEVSVKCCSSVLLHIYEVQSDLLTQFLFATSCEIVAGKYQFPCYMWGHQSAARFSGLALFMIFEIAPEFSIVYASQLRMVEWFRCRFRAIFHKPWM